MALVLALGRVAVGGAPGLVAWFAFAAFGSVVQWVAAIAVSVPVVVFLALVTVVDRHNEKQQRALFRQIESAMDAVPGGHHVHCGSVLIGVRRNWIAPRVLRCDLADGVTHDSDERIVVQPAAEYWLPPLGRVLRIPVVIPTETCAAAPPRPTFRSTLRDVRHGLLTPEPEQLHGLLTELRTGDACCSSHPT
ncbi:hypothetical protein [Actinocatenispora rupis]|uniref:Uncharacterized protein n=1 Tax=Actinocatenispora rupis TaxID=519421 RepID=A0A8J3JEB5_9ACTN|nr:hypothetical protein [Actinocatenispora rupis]GID14907.1 hypothetical protein Aru02nite_57960 [Actinocatenispora rupis]